MLKKASSHPVHLGLKGGVFICYADKKKPLFAESIHLEDEDKEGFLFVG